MNQPITRLQFWLIVIWAVAVIALFVTEPIPQ